MKRLFLLVLAVCLTALPIGALAAPAEPEARREAQEAPLVLPDPPVVRIAVAQGTNNVVLSWDHVIEAGFYEVYRGVAPYFSPATAGEGNRINDIPGSGAGTTVSVTDDGTDYYAADGTMTPVQVLGLADVNYFWVVRSRSLDGGVSDYSAHVGEFDFELIKGS